MKKSILATILVFASIVGITGSALADTYVFTGLGGGGTALSLMWADGHLYAGMDTGHIWRYEGDANNTWTDFASLGNPVLSLAWDGQSIYAGTHGHLEHEVVEAEMVAVCIHDRGVPRAREHETASGCAARPPRSFGQATNPLCLRSLARLGFREGASSIQRRSRRD